METGRQIVGVFGANGFIGRALVRHLVAGQRRVVAFGRSFPPDYAELVGGAVETRTVNFNDVLSVHAMVQDMTHVVQLINSSSPGLGNSRAVDDIHTNVAPHVAFIESCLMSQVKSFLFVSSGGTVYGEPRYTPIDEAHPLRPMNSYGLTKMMVEHYLRVLSKAGGMRAISLRVSNPFGPGQTPKKGQGLIGSILHNHALGVPTTIFGDGSARRDFVYIDDVIEALDLALDGPPVLDEINIGSGVGRSVIEVVRAVEHALGKPLALEYSPGRPTDTQANILDCAKAAEILGWSARTDFDVALGRTVAAWS